MASDKSKKFSQYAGIVTVILEIIGLIFMFYYLGTSR